MHKQGDGDGRPTPFVEKAKKEGSPKANIALLAVVLRQLVNALGLPEAQRAELLAGLDMVQR